MPKDSARRCRYCGGTLWQDDDIEKCLMCSRPAEGPGPSSAAGTAARLSHPKLPGTAVRTAHRKDK